MHKFIRTSEPVSHSRAAKKADPFEEKELEEYISIPDIVEKAKNQSIDILTYLTEHIHIEEVSCE